MESSSRNPGDLALPPPLDLSPKRFIETLCARADIGINGDRPWDIQVHDQRFYGRVVSRGSLALGESYMDGWWDCADLAEFFNRLLRARLDRHFGKNLSTFLYFAAARLFNRQDRTRSAEVVDKHYDIGNDIYLAFLDPYNQYTCGFFEDTDDLAIAQERKLDLICRKLRLRPGETLLDIGCGWGGLAKFAAERYGVRVTGISISDEQITYAREFCKGLPVSIEHRDYREMQGAFDKVVSVGMLEHVGHKNYRTYMEVVNRVLRDDGLFLLHCIGGNGSTAATDPWIDKYIFPNGMLPSIEQLGKAVDRLLVMEDWQNFGAYYDQTLHAWSKNFDAAWPKLKEKYGDIRFYRMWRYYFLMCAGTFRARVNQVWQIVLTKSGAAEVYHRPQYGSGGS